MVKLMVSEWSDWLSRVSVDQSEHADLAIQDSQIKHGNGIHLRLTHSYLHYNATIPPRQGSWKYDSDFPPVF
jgi:hypothetical protein